MCQGSQLAAKFPSSNHSVTLPPGMFTAAQKIISHVSMSFPEYVHLIFWEEQAAGVKVRQEIFLEALKPFRFWSIPNNSHRVKALKSPCGDRAVSTAASAYTCPNSFLWDPVRGTKPRPQGDAGRMNRLRGVGAGWWAATTMPVSRLQGSFSLGFAHRAGEAGCQGEYFFCLGKATSIWLALQPVAFPLGSSPVTGHGPHRLGLFCDQQEVLTLQEATSGGPTQECVGSWAD